MWVAPVVPRVSVRLRWVALRKVWGGRGDEREDDPGPCGGGHLDKTFGDGVGTGVA